MLNNSCREEDSHVFLGGVPGHLPVLGDHRDDWLIMDSLRRSSLTDTAHFADAFPSVTSHLRYSSGQEGSSCMFVRVLIHGMSIVAAFVVLAVAVYLM